MCAANNYLTKGIDSDVEPWLTERKVQSVELIVPDMAGLARGKILPISQLVSSEFRLPVAVFGQTINGSYHMWADNLVDHDMTIRPDISTLRQVPWTVEPTASVMMDCFDDAGSYIEIAPRAVLKRVIARFEEQGWYPVVGPEVEFYLSMNPDHHGHGVNFEFRKTVESEQVIDSYGIDRVHELGGFFRNLTEYCREFDIAIGAISQELGAGQFEVNFECGDPLKLADDVFHFKRTLKHVARSHGLHATFLAKPDSGKPGSSMHIHQSVNDLQQQNIFSTMNGEPSDLFRSFMGGLQTYLADALLLFAPYPNSYRRFLSHWSSPVNLEWGIDNRTVGLRVPVSDPNGRRIENRLPGSDVNPYLAIAGTLACGFLGMTRNLDCKPSVQGSAYDVPFALHRIEYEAIDSFRKNSLLRELLGDNFVTLYSAVKEKECREFQERVPDWERVEMNALI